MNYQRSRTLLLSLFGFIVCVFTPSFAIANDTLSLFANGHQLRVVPASGEAFTVEFSSDGTYKTTLGSSGKWSIVDDMLCTVRDSDAKQSCGVFPRGKKRGDAWATKDGNRQNVTVTILAPKGRG